MVTRKTTKKSTPAKTKVATVRKKPAAKSAKKSAAPTKVDYYPNRMTLAISVLAVTVLLLVTIISVLGARG